MPDTPSLGASGTAPVTRPEKVAQVQNVPVEEVHILGENSPGVRRIEIISSHFRLVDRVFLFASVFLIAYVYGLDGLLRNAYQVCLTT